MNVFDKEMGPLASEEELASIKMLAEMLTLREYRAWRGVTGHAS